MTLALFPVKPQSLYCVNKAAIWLAVGLFLVSCVSPQKTYHAPNDAKVRAATKDLTVKVEKVSTTADKAKKATEDAKTALDESPCANDLKLQATVGESKSLVAQLRIEVDEAKASRAALQNEVDSYTTGAAELAIDATNERNEKIEVQKKLLWYRLRWWGGIVALIATVAAWVIFGLLKVGIRWGTK